MSMVLHNLVLSMPHNCIAYLCDHIERLPVAPIRHAEISTASLFGKDVRVWRLGWVILQPCHVQKTCKTVCLVILPSLPVGCLGFHLRPRDCIYRILVTMLQPKVKQLTQLTVLLQCRRHLLGVLGFRPERAYPQPGSTRRHLVIHQ